MKQLETLKSFFFDRELMLMYVSFIYGGICLFLFSQNLFVALSFRMRPGPEFEMNFSNETQPPNETFITIFMDRRNPRLPALMPAEQFLYLFGAVFGILNGIHLHRLMDRKKEVKAKYSVMEKLLSEEQKAIVKIIKDGGGEELQSTITKKAKLSRLKVHRILSRLEKKGIIEKHQFGMTNKIFLK